MGYEAKRLPARLSFYISFNWDNRKVWALDLPVEKARVKDWEWHLDLPFWSTVRGQPNFDLEPRRVLEEPTRHLEHWERIEKVETSFPVDTFFSGGRWVIMDGIHRLVRLVMDEVEEFTIRRVPHSAVTVITVPDGSVARPLLNGPPP